MSESRSIKTDDYIRILKELYQALWLNPKDEVKYNLLWKYADKLPHRIAERELLWQRALEHGKNNNLLKDLVYSDNPFLKFIPKDECQWQGYTFVVIKDPDDPSSV